jgi:hypothetical protein
MVRNDGIALLESYALGEDAVRSQRDDDGISSPSSWRVSARRCLRAELVLAASRVIRSRRPSTAWPSGVGQNSSASAPRCVGEVPPEVMKKAL